MLDKLKVAQLVGAAAVLLSAFGVYELTEETQQAVVVLITGLVTIVSTVLSAYVKREKIENLQKLALKGKSGATYRITGYNTLGEQ